MEIFFPEGSMAPLYIDGMGWAVFPNLNSPGPLQNAGNNVSWTDDIQKLAEASSFYCLSPLVLISLFKIWQMA
jgi:hypothetical protein